MPPFHLPAARSDIREAVERYGADRAALYRRYDDRDAPERRARLRAMATEWATWLAETPSDGLNPEGRLDAALLHLQLRRDLAELDLADARYAECAALAPAAASIHGLHSARRRMEAVDPRAAAATLAAIAATAAPPAGDAPGAIIALRAAGLLDRLRGVLADWHAYYAGYDPAFTWWTAAPFRSAVDALQAQAKALREEGAGLRGEAEDAIIGDPIGEAALRAALGLELIPYGAEELIAIADREFAWCEAELRRAASDMGCADWHEALEQVKESFVEPGRQPELIRDLALEAIEFVRERDLLTIPPLAEEIWRMEMMSAEDQRVNPFFLGGERIVVSFPTDAMSHADKRMSLRGNNPHFARATVQHELIPGHHLQGFMLERYQPHREAFGTPFWIEGWALHWEMRLWELGFPRSPENRMGMLFWRTHRAARVVFSLRFHLGRMTPAECIAMLVERVGHEPANAAAEVRRSFQADYPPLYQAAYLIGGLQFHALHRELVVEGGMRERDFHDAVLQGNQMPVEMVRARLTGAVPAPGAPSTWRFAG